MKPIRAVELLIEKIKKDYPQDVSLVVIMGSQIYGEDHPRSDIDMFFVPKTERGQNLAFDCIIDEIGYDFWGLDWERLERIANHQEKITSIITEGKVLYFAAQEDLDRWNGLVAHALDMTDEKKFLRLAQERLNAACGWYVPLSRTVRISDARYFAIELIYELCHSIALLNHSMVKRGRKKLKGEILAMPLVPEDFARLYDTAFQSNHAGEISAAFGGLLENTQKLLRQEELRIYPRGTFQEVWDQRYEELINCYNKILYSIEVNSPVTAMFAAAELRRETQEPTEGTGVSTAELPDVLGAYSPRDLGGIGKAALKNKAALEQLLGEQGVPIRRLSGEKELAEFMEKL